MTQSTTEIESDPSTQPSLVEPDDLAPVESEPGLRERAAAFEARVKAWFDRRWRHRPTRYGTLIVALALVGVGAWVVYERTRFEPPPDYTTAGLDEVFNYTLLTDDFNRLSIEERLELIQQLVARLKEMGGNDSVMMALFASMIAGEARAQLEENASRLAVDLMDSYATSYDRGAPIQVRDAFVEAKVVEFQKTMEALAGEVRDVSDEERLEEARKQARRDMGRIRDGKVEPDQMLRMFDVLNNGIGKHATGHQKTRISSFVRDMVYTLRRGDADGASVAP